MRLAFLLLLVCAGIGARADLGTLDPQAKPDTRLSPGFTLALSVSLRGVDEAELCGSFPLDEAGRLALKVGGEEIPRIELKGLTIAEAKERIRTALRKYYAVEPEVLAGIAKIPRIQVLVEGATFRSGWLTLPQGARLTDALAECRYMPGADLEHIQVSRIEKNGTRSQRIADFRKALEGQADEFTDPPLQNNDRITLPLSPVPVVPQTVMVLGEVRSPGLYGWTPGMRVRDALQAARGLLATADSERVVIRRMRGNTHLTVNAAQAQENVPTENVELRPDDTVFVMRRDSGLRYAVMGAVPMPATYDWKKPVSLMKALQEAGGVKPDADRRSVVLIRNMLQDPTRAESVSLNLDLIARGELPDPMLQPGDVVQVPQKKKASSPLLDIGMFLLRMLVF